MIKIAGIEFDNHSYDGVADVLYLSVGEPQVPAETDATPEGHAVDFDAAGNIIGMVIVSIRHLLELDGERSGAGGAVGDHQRYAEFLRGEPVRGGAQCLNSIVMRESTTGAPGRLASV
jgi:uncharacterized protein YuzE